MTLAVGVIGTGTIGREHLRRLTTVLSGVRVVAVSDVDAAVAARVAAAVGARVLTGTRLITDPSVDAVLVCSWGGTHDEYVLAAVAAGKPVFCEKPLATTPAACLRIVEAELGYGPGWSRSATCAATTSPIGLSSGNWAAAPSGAPLMMHCAHRNAGVPSFYAPDDMITDTAVHEIDMVRWMFGTEIDAVRVPRPRPSSHAGGLPDPLLLILELANGVLADVAITVNARYGYDIRGEILGETGTAALGEMSPVMVRRTGRPASPIPADWRERFLAAYDVELREWVTTVRAGGAAAGPDAWDGYAATTVAAAALLALRTGERAQVVMEGGPELCRPP